MKQEVFISEENGENLLVIRDDDSRTTFTVFPDEKKFTEERKYGGHYEYWEKKEYRISNNPICLEVRTMELSYESWRGFLIKDGVVLESEIRDSLRYTPSHIDDFKKKTQWSNISLLDKYRINLYILSKHPEIISKDEYRRFLRELVERIKKGVYRVKEIIKNEKTGLEIQSQESGFMNIWYSDNDLADINIDEYDNLSDDQKNNSPFGRKIKYAADFNKNLFDEKSADFVGICENEFNCSSGIIEYIEELLNK